MRYWSRSIRLSLLTLGAGLLSAAIHFPAPAQAPSIGGLWRFNAEKSERIEDKIQAARGRPGGIARGAGGPGGGGTLGRRTEGSLPPLTVMSFAQPVLQVLIRQDDSTVSISDAVGQMRTVDTRGQKITEIQRTGDELTTTAKWKEGRLEIEREFEDQGRVRERYSIDAATKQLVVEIKLSGILRRDIELRRVYDPAPQGQ
ncbi:MAG: hypothetical protein HOP28_08845 [Gemmatimonadales bacterium]|nr:hypothetical protein [Gemmatimonadales bacterium]